MSNIVELLQHKPQSTNPKDSSRVYFACHPDDFDDLFDRFSDEILSATHSLDTTTTVWYRTVREPNDEQRKDIISRLSEIQLFVVPVTREFLDDRDLSLDFEIAYAKEHNIPILPLVWDTSIIIDYSLPENFGELQFLNPEDPDLTALPYSKKLESYLSSVLVGDELRKKVQAAFDAYIFLSYRKKDRQYAQELMKLIHKNDFCRDIAIWYDEFLTPGENFNKAISTALEESKLFALVVTPHIVEPGNYVIDHEYPMAETAQKPIVALESVATDRKALDKSFKNLPDCTDVHNQQKLSDALLKNLESVARAESRDNPEHNYLIGLAYLNGIDVETDHERAKALIEGAAESGLPEAMLKLAEMYKTGKGVKQNHRKTIHWLEKAVACFEETAKSNDPNDIRKFANTLFYLSAEYMAVGDHKGSDEALKKQIKLYTSAIEQSIDEDYIGIVLVAYLMRSANVVHLYVDENPDTTIPKTFEISIELLSEAERFWEKYSEFAKDVDWIRAYVNIIYAQICSGYAAMGDYDKARLYLDKLVGTEDYESLKNMIASLESGQAGIGTIMDSIKDSLDSLQQQLTELSKEDKEINIGIYLISSYSIVCGLCIAPLDDSVDRQDIRRTLYRYLSMVSQIDCNKVSNDAVLALCAVLSSVADFEAADGNIKEATELYKKSLEFSKLSFERYSSEDPLKSIILSTSKLDQLRGDGRLDPEAWRYVDQCYHTIFTENYKRIQNFELADTYYLSMILVYEQENNLEKAKEYAKAREYLSFIKLKEKGGLENQIQFCNNVFACCQYKYRTEEYDTITDYLGGAIDLCATILSKPKEYNPTREQYDHLGLLLCRCEYLQAAVYSELDREDDAEEMLKMFLQAAEIIGRPAELEEEIAIAEEWFADDDEDEEE